MMRRITVFMLLLTCLSIAKVHAKKSYKIDHVRIEAVVFPDGEVQVVEKRAYNFKGKFSYAFRNFPHQENVTFADFEVMEGEVQFPFSGEEEEGFAVLLDKKNHQELGWAFDARDEIREFTIAYTVNGLVERYEDVAVLYYKFIDSQWDVRQENVSVTIRFKGKGDEEGEVLHWLHGPAQAFSEMQDDGAIKLESNFLTKKDMLEVRVLYPEAWFEEVPQRSGMVAVDIKTEEQKWAEEANAKRLAAKEREAFFADIYAKAPFIAMGLFLVGFGFALFIYRKFRPEYPKAESSQSIENRPPSNLHPAFVNYLLYGYLIGRELTAVLYQLAYKKMLRLEDRNEDGKNSNKKLFWILDRERFKGDENTLYPFEHLVIHQIFTKISKGANEVSFYEMQKAKHNWASFMAKFNKAVAEEGKGLDIWNARSIIGMYWMVGLSIFMFCTFALGLAFIKEWSLLLVPLLVILIVLCIRLPRRQPKYQQEYFRWLSYRKYLKSALRRKSDEKLDYELLNEHLIYGTTLGLTKSNIDKLLTNVPNGNYSHYLFWYVVLFNNGSAPSSKTISNMVSNLSISPMSSGGGTGGGASFGGGGGVSAGGGGAR
ncbi:DUF2207 domain-containing protein [Litoribacter alkaliphilus]|uniref:DUF2207 domain-containing protein n=1 Tax=Litoribacter ruber TaxID=702568 RepID=A0AAP2CEN9_9BACT|nr:DUF2207 domain-containing protein [Litoribacter alkaliphilus]MBS9523108.1 DUF2207 domain-containing protein [Litoribacter alkaliphilus]